MTRWIAAVSLLAACLLASPDAAPAAPAEAARLLDDVLEALSNVLQFMLQHPSDLIADSVFGVVLAKGQLKNLEKLIPKYPDRFVFRPSKRTYVLLATKLLEKMCEEIVKVAPTEPPPNATGYKIMMDKLLQFHLWELDKPMRKDILLNSDVYKNSVDPVENLSDVSYMTLKQYHTVLQVGSPSEPQSDKCIVEILNSTSCKSSQECRQIETGGVPPTGYSTTHRLLYLQIVRQIGCGKSPYFPGINKRIVGLCAAILKEAEFIAKIGVSPLLEDLFFEQIALCGMEGFAEFIRPEWIQMILDRQRPQGCYGNEEDLKIASHTRVKRNDVVSSYGCLMHTTGLAATTLALSARALVELDGL